MGPTTRTLTLVFLWLVSGLRGIAGTVEEWNAVFLAAVQAEATSPCLAARNLAILHTAVHDAVNVSEPKFEVFLKQADEIEGSQGRMVAEAAAAISAYTVATALYPSRASDFDLVLARQWAGLTKGDAVDKGQELGRKYARRLLDHRAHDGSSTTEHYVPVHAPGKWRRPPSNRPPETPGWRRVTLFSLEKADQFPPPGPPALESPAYTEELEQLRQFGGVVSSGRTAGETESARFWADFSYTSTPPGHWNEIARFLALKQKLPLHESARLFACLNVALADTGVATWECKYRHNSWRPNTAIALADSDGNDATAADPSWKPLLNIPPHPEYVSGHSAFSGAAAAVLGRIFGTEGIEFQVTSFDLPGKVRTYHSFTECRDEISNSRVWGGIHFPSACRDGMTMGDKIGHWVCDRQFRILPKKGQDDR